MSENLHTDMPPWPVELRYRSSEKTLYISFDNGEDLPVTAEYLRVESPSAEVQGHHPSAKIQVTGKQNVAITNIKPVGNYAVRIVFDDGHRTGIYTWDALYKMAKAFQEHRQRH